MSANSAIEWTDHTFNPWWGCAKVSPACDHCYAERDARRFKPREPMWGTAAEGRVRFVWPESDRHHVSARANFDNAAKHWAEPLKWNSRAVERGGRARVFCASMADVFDNHPAVADERTRLWALIHKTPALDWLLLTKRVGNVTRMVPEAWLRGHWPRNAWLGATVVNQEEADRDVPKLLELPARVRFLSIEPMLGSVNLLKLQSNGRTLLGDLQWVIAGGESGPHARPPHADWFRGLRDQCAAADVPFLFKQWGEWSGPGISFPDGHPELAEEDESARFKVGKKAAGRLLDGVQHDGVPA